MTRSAPLNSATAKGSRSAVRRSAAPGEATGKIGGLLSFPLFTWTAYQHHGQPVGSIKAKSSAGDSFPSGQEPEKISSIKTTANQTADSGTLPGGCISVATAAPLNSATAKGSRSAVRRSAPGEATGKIGGLLSFSLFTWTAYQHHGQPVCSIKAKSSAGDSFPSGQEPEKISSIKTTTNQAADSGTLPGGCISVATAALLHGNGQR